MKLWLISQTVNDGYDTFDAVVVAAKTEGEAQRMLPCPCWSGIHEWAEPKDVAIKLIGTAAKGTEAKVILASFNAG